jgi:Bpu10I restriction endonuclease
MTAHLDKLEALKENPKLPEIDRPKVMEAFDRYQDWQNAMNDAKGTPSEIILSFIKATNEYKKFVEVDLIFDSKEDFLYRQKGQLKLDNTILEEFMPRLVDVRLVPGLSSVENLITGPQQCFAGFYIGPINSPLSEGGIFIKTKDQDFTFS